VVVRWVMPRLWSAFLAADVILVAAFEY
jgi:hypothetical protein